MYAEFLDAIWASNALKYLNFCVKTNQNYEIREKQSENDEYPSNKMLVL